MNAIELTPLQVSLAAALVLLNAAVSLLLRLRMEWTLLWASLRTITQLMVVGLVLEWVFQMDRWFVVLGLASAMSLVAAITATQRASVRYAGMLRDALLSLMASSWLVTAYALLVVLHGPNRTLTQWYDPQYLIPLLGMVLGNALNGISLGLKSFTDDLLARREEIETRLALGATAWEAAHPVVQDAIRTGMIPIVNAMLIVGLVSLPGMMTGQILAGVPPWQAVRYQMVIMFLIAAASPLGTVTIVLLCYRRLFNRNQQLEIDRLRP